MFRALPSFVMPGPSRPRPAVDLGPSGADRLPRPRGGQDQEPEGQRGHPILLFELSHESADLCPWQRGVMCHLRDLRPGGQDVIEMTLPSRRVLAGAPTVNLGVIQYGLDAPADP